ncbi:MAG: DUF2213 domain-containing protein [Synergistaceae bacterium]|jgi:hypothetical protein|nr:DUF2213 domain-containing protein [Synergistaceae bacterium]
MNKYYITESLGEVRKRTPEGYLLCVGVPIARTGEYEYRADEFPDFDGREDGTVVCERASEIVFSDEAIASFEGKPFVIGHPPEGVDITNWGDYAAGVVQNVRRGEGGDGDLLVADILVTSPEAVSEIDAGVREISCGYDGEYEQTEPGRVRLNSMIGNHVALVERGRAGHRVAIGDEAAEAGKEGDGQMTVKGKEKKVRFMDWLRDAFKKATDEGIVLEISGTPEAPPDEGAEGGKEETAFDAQKAFGDLSAKLDALVSAIGAASASGKDGEASPDGHEEETAADGEPEGGQEEPGGKKAEDVKTGDAAKAPAKKTAAGKTADTANTLDSRKAATFRSEAETLAPGFDTRSLTLDSQTSLVSGMRKVLEEACLRDAAVRRDVTETYGDAIRSWAAVDDADVRTLFAVAAKCKAERNNEGAKVGVRDFAVVGQMTVDDIRREHEEFWGKKKGDR